jgi:[ribosomal protein S18]-alanine N-acetyltransferase
MLPNEINLSEMLSQNNLKIIEYEPTNYSDIIKIWQATGLAPPERNDSPESIITTLQLGGKLYLLVRLGDQANNIIGTSWITNDGRRLYVHHVAIAPQHQGKGFGKFLIIKSLLYGKKLNLQMKLEVSEANSVAIKLYEKYGFTRLGDYDVYIVRNYH